MATNLFLEDERLINAFNKGGKFARDYTAVLHEVENMENGEPINFFNLIKILGEGCRIHDSGKIEGIQSIDSTAHCSFCSEMRAKAAAHPELNIICGSCYDYKQETGHKVAVYPRHWLNMKIMSLFTFPVEILSMLPLYTVYVRINSSGDIVNFTHMVNLINIAVTHPAISLTLWSKNNIIVEKAFDTYGKPENMRYIQSSYLVNVAAKKSRYADCTFTVYDKDHINEAIAGGAAVCNGQKCEACGWKCYKCEAAGGHADGANVAELLRDR